MRPERLITEDSLRAVLRKILVPDLVEKIVEASIADRAEAPRDEATPEEITRAVALAHADAQRPRRRIPKNITKPSSR